MGTRRDAEQESAHHDRAGSDPGISGSPGGIVLGGGRPGQAPGEDAGESGESAPVLGEVPSQIDHEVVGPRVIQEEEDGSERRQPADAELPEERDRDEHETHGRHEPEGRLGRDQVPAEQQRGPRVERVEEDLARGGRQDRPPLQRSMWEPTGVGDLECVPPIPGNRRPDGAHARHEPASDPGRHHHERGGDRLPGAPAQVFGPPEGVDPERSTTERDEEGARAPDDPADRQDERIEHPQQREDQREGSDRREPHPERHREEREGRATETDSGQQAQADPRDQQVRAELEDLGHRGRRHGQDSRRGPVRGRSCPSAAVPGRPTRPGAPQVIR